MRLIVRGRPLSLLLPSAGAAPAVKLVCVVPWPYQSGHRFRSSIAISSSNPQPILYTRCNMQTQLVAKAAPGLAVQGLGRVSQARKAVLVRAKEMREFREDTGEVTVAGDEKKKEKALYADQVPAAVSFQCQSLIS